MRMFLDLHSHALPKIDDGAQDEREALEILRMSRVQGVGWTVLTPHCTLHKQDSVKNFLLKRQASYDCLLSAMEKTNFELPGLLLGAEIYADHDISGVSDIERLCIAGSRYLLIEFALGDRLEWLSECVYRLNRKEIVPIIAHVERYPQREQIFDDLHDLNVIYQMNASCFLSLGGRRRIKQLLHREAHFVVASDMHNLTSRPCNLEQAYRICRKKLPNHSEALFFDNAQRILNI